MSERKVLNKYYPPDFDPSKLPRVKREKNRQFTIRLMAPFNMRCKTCGEYIYRGKKFNARKEDVIGKTYLGIQIYRFYIKCTKCLAEITFLTDPENADYEMENGAIRNFECIRLAEKQAELEAKQEKEEEANNPMKILENRTRDSRREMAVLETLEDIRELNAANASVDLKVLLEAEEEMKMRIAKEQEEEDEEEIRRIFGKSRASCEIDEEPEEEDVEIEPKKEKREIKRVLESDDTIVLKKPKTEPDEPTNKKASNHLGNFLTNNFDIKPGQVQPTNSKNKISSFIKKKTEPIPAPVLQTITNPLGSLADYSSSEDDTN